MPKQYLDVDVDEGVITASGKKQQGGAGRRGRPKGSKTVNQKKPNQWLELVKKVRSQQPGMSYKEALRIASQIKATHGYEESLGAGFNFKEFIGKVADKVGTVAKKAYQVGKKVATDPRTKKAVKKAIEVATPIAKQMGERALEHGKPHLEKLAQEGVERAVAKISGTEREAKPISGIIKTGASDVGKKLAHEGLSMASYRMRQSEPKLSPYIKQVEEAIHEKIGKGVTDGEEGKYLGACCKACAEQEASGGAIGSIIAALAPVVVPAATHLISKLLGKGVVPAGEAYHQTPTDRLHEAEPKTGKGTPGDYSFNELGRSNDPFTGHVTENFNNNSIHKSIMGGNILEAQKSDPPTDNVWATHAQLWWFTPVPGFMGRTELPANQFFMGNSDVNLHIWEQANDVDQYINSPPTFEDGVTQIAPSTLAINPREVSTMPQGSTLGSTLRDISAESTPATGSWGRLAREREGRGFVYAPGMSLSSQANRFGGGLFSMPGSAGRGAGGDITRVGYPGQQGRGVIPPESVQTGTPVGISQRGRGAMIKGSNIATWR